MTEGTDLQIAEQPVSDSDYVELSRLITEITWRTDHSRASTVHELFVEDGALNLRPDQILSGRQTLQQWGQDFERSGWRVRHAVTNMRFLSAGPDTATGTTFLMVYMIESDELGSSLPWNIGEDHDRFVRTEDDGGSRNDGGRSCPRSNGDSTQALAARSPFGDGHSRKEATGQIRLTNQGPNPCVTGRERSCGRATCARDQPTPEETWRPQLPAFQPRVSRGCSARLSS